MINLPPAAAVNSTCLVVITVPCLISFMGALAGIVLGVVLCLVQQEFGLISLGSGNSAGAFVVDAYPVSVHLSDVLLVLVTVLVISFLSVQYPVRYLSKRLLGKTT